MRGDILTIDGTGLGGAAVTIGGAPASVTRNTGMQITTSVPIAAAIGIGSLVVATFGGISPTAISAFTVLPDAAPASPVINALSSVAGPAGMIVVINGSGFAAVTSVTIGGAAATITSNNGTSITTTVPLAATIGAGSLVLAHNNSAIATWPFSVLTGPNFDITMPNPSKRAFITGPGHFGANGAGPEINAYPMPPTRC
ncbi:MAG: IPT/TIG domain-containing protein, partial [Usitatibacteraceae bacterium]